MDIKPIFKPTWNRVVLTVIIGLILTIAGIFLAIFSAHGSDVLEYFSIIIIWPLALLGRLFKFGLFYSTSLPSILLSAFVQLLYYYILISIISYFIRNKNSAERK